MKRSLSLLSSKASSITNKYNCSVFDDMGENDMRFIDVLRQQPQSVNIVSEEDFYQECLKEKYEDLKSFINKADVRNDKNVKSGFYILPTYIALYRDEDTKLPKLCETTINYGIIKTTAKATLTPTGRRITDDFIRLAEKDGIKIWFTPLFLSYYGEQEVSGFDSFEKVAGRKGTFSILIHYEIHL